MIEFLGLSLTISLFFLLISSSLIMYLSLNHSFPFLTLSVSLIWDPEEKKKRGRKKNLKEIRERKGASFFRGTKLS